MSHINAEDAKRIEQLQAEIRNIEANSARSNLERAVKKGYEDDKLYEACKGFTNFIDKGKRQNNIKLAQQAKHDKKEQQSNEPIPAV